MVQIHGKRYALRGETGESDILTLINSCFTHQTGKGDLHNERPGINTILENGWCNNLSPDHRELKWVRNTCRGPTWDGCGMPGNITGISPTGISWAASRSKRAAAAGDFAQGL